MQRAISVTSPFGYMQSTHHSPWFSVDHLKTLQRNAVKTTCFFRQQMFDEMLCAQGLV